MGGKKSNVFTLLSRPGYGKSPGILMQKKKKKNLPVENSPN